jgi:hypothetical protein
MLFLTSFLIFESPEGKPTLLSEPEAVQSDIQARELMVEGAVSMTRTVLTRLEKENIATLTLPERATLLTNPDDRSSCRKPARNP